MKPPRGTSLPAAVNGAIVSLARALAIELSPVRVNVIMPGVIDTAIHGEKRAEIKAWAESAALPARRFGQPQDVADAAVFLMTNPYMTGHACGRWRLSADMSAAARNETLSLQGQRVVIVGGTSGMGLGAARAAAAAGAKVVVAGRRAVQVRSLSPSDGADPFEHHLVDVNDEPSVRATFEAIGQLDHLLVTAAPGGRSSGAFLEQDVQSAQQYVSGKLLGSWVCARHAAPWMRSGGSITFLTGCASIRPRRGSSMVTATFAALEALSQALALELGPLRVNTIRPGLIDSEMWSFLDEPAREELRRKRARCGLPETNPYVTGIVLEVSGGEPLVSLAV